MVCAFYSIYYSLVTISYENYYLEAPWKDSPLKIHQKIHEKNTYEELSKAFLREIGMLKNANGTRNTVFLSISAQLVKHSWKLVYEQS